MKFILFLLLSVILFQPIFAAEKNILIDASKKFQTIDGFGVNINPLNWQYGHLEPVLDMLVDDLGCTLIRFDPYGLADWLDPEKRETDGTWPDDYLEEIYTSPDFQNAWAAFRYLNKKGVEPFINVSGRIAPGLAGIDGETLVDYDGYAEMCVTMLKWARDKEKLKFSLFAPFNETDLGFVEGPALPPSGVAPAIRAIINKLDLYGMSDIKLIVLGDAGPYLNRLEPILVDSEFLDRIVALSTHTYGNGGDEDFGGWFTSPNNFDKFVQGIQNTPYKNKGIWLSEYGDLDQSGEVEFGMAWRSSRRLLKLLESGFTAAQAWDAYDNFHKHDDIWCTYGLIFCDPQTKKYAPKRRYYAAKHVYKFVKPGMRRVAVLPVDWDATQTHAEFKSPMKNLRLLAFISDAGELSLVGMSSIEEDTQININLSEFNLAGDKELYYFRSSRHEDCVNLGAVDKKAGRFSFTVPEQSLFTITTIREK